MPARLAEQNVFQALERLGRRLNRLEDACKRRILPPGYEFEVDGAGNIVITRVSDDATGTVVIT